MNTNEYIEKYSKTEKTKEQLIVTMKVPPRKVANIHSEVSEESQKRKVKSSDVALFLEVKGYKNLTCLTKALTIDNCHARGLEKTWIFNLGIKSPPRKRTKKKTTNEK
jgi:hypothetical protein